MTDKNMVLPAGYKVMKKMMKLIGKPNRKNYLCKYKHVEFYKTKI